MSNIQYLSLEPLFDWLRRNVDTTETTADREANKDVSLYAFADRCGVNRYTIRRWRDAGRIQYWRADEICCHMSVHPLEIWGDEWTQLLIDQDSRLLKQLVEARRGLRRVGEVIKTIVKIHGDSYRSFAAELGWDHVRLNRMARGEVVPTDEEYNKLMTILIASKHEV